MTGKNHTVIEEDVILPGDDDKDVVMSVQAEDDVQIEVVDDTPERDRGRQPLAEPVEDPTDEELSSYSEKVQAKIKKLTHRSHDERRAKEAALREKQELEKFAKALLEKNKELQNFVQTGSQQYIDQAKTLVERDIETAKRKLREAQEAFDTDAIIAAQDELLDAKLRAREVQNFRAPPVQEESFTVQTPQVEQNDTELDEKTLRWQAKNQWFGSKGFEDVSSYALGLHDKLVRNGVDPTTDEYFQQLDSNIRSKFPEVFGEQDQPRSGVTSKKPASVVAPAVRSSGVKKIRLTATQVATAEKLGITLQQYAEALAKLES